MIEGKIKDNNFESKKLRVGLFEAKVVVINPDEDDYKEILGQTLKVDSKKTEYLGETKNGDSYVRIDIWLQDVNDIDEEDKTVGKYKATFFVENRDRENKDENKTQYINRVGTCSWAEDENSLKDWFKKTDYRVAKKGEEELYFFLRTWLGKLDYRDPDTTLHLDWKKLMKGNMKELHDMINCPYSNNLVALATIISKNKDTGVVEYQAISNKAFLPTYTLPHFRNIDYKNAEILQKLKEKRDRSFKDRRSDRLGSHENAVLQICGEYGETGYFILKKIRDYNPEENPISSDTPIIREKEEYTQKKDINDLPF